ncbi:MAG: extracellular solute-binding protein [Anaerolineales bacterium]|nr:extracellular solute-binding protein [Anaerolineales bacterium]MCW5854637.1 extracellular solute-binding protein [Anaerolineales bacterium]
MKKQFQVLFSLLLVGAFVLGACAAPAAATSAPAEETNGEEETGVLEPVAEAQADRVQIYWYIGLGTGAQPDQIPKEREWVEKFNASQDRIQLIMIVVDNRFARDNLTAQIAAGNAPDIVGPVGTEGRGFFPDAFLDLQPLVDQFQYDTSDIDPAFLEFYKDQGSLVGLPFAIFPSAVFYNRDLFDEAGLAYPPHEVGEPYTLDGQEVEWNFDTLAELARRLTVDTAGNDATSAAFDASSIAQYGFDFQWTKDSPRWFSAYFEPFYPVAADGTAVLSDGQVEAINWYYDAMWGAQPFLPSQAAMDSDLISGNSFSSGKVAMGLTHLWYTCCIDKTSVPNWDVAVVPSHNGVTTAKMHGDTFAIMNTTAHPEEAFEVYSYMLGEGSADLYAIYGGLPARSSQQQAFFDGQAANFAPNEVDWDVFLKMISYLEVPGHELVLPNVAKSHDAFLQLGSDLRSNPDLDVSARLTQFLADLTAIYQEVE